jgi:VWFA-related protein
VIVDVVVTQGKGEPVVGLHKDDFQVSEDGNAQTISFFEEHTGGTVSPVTLPPMPPGVYTNYPTIKTTDSINVLLLDSLNTQASDQSYVRPQMVKYFRTALAAPSGARIAIFTLGSKLRMVRGFTPDSAGSLAALTDPKSGFEVKFESQLASGSRKTSEQLACSEIKAPVAIAACKDFFAEEDASRTADRVVMTLQAFQALAHYLERFPGRKNVMWVSGSFPLSFFPESNPRGGHRQEYRREIRQTADLLTADQVAVYPISATGLTGVAGFHPRDPLSVQSDESQKPIRDVDPELVQTISMDALAQDTGGKPFYNTNDLSVAVKEAINIGSHYYTLTYTPTNVKLDGKFRRIEVKGINRSYKLAYRRGYYMENAETEQALEQRPVSDPLLPFMSFGMPDVAEILYKVRVAELEGPKSADPTKSVVRYRVDFAILPQDVKLQANAEGDRTGNIEVGVIAYDYDGKVLNAIGKKIPIRLQHDLFAKMQQGGFQLHEEIELPKTDVFLQTGIYDLTANHAGTLAIPVHVVAPPAASK